MTFIRKYSNRRLFLCFSLRRFIVNIIDKCSCHNLRIVGVLSFKICMVFDTFRLTIIIVINFFLNFPHYLLVDYIKWIIIITEWKLRVCFLFLFDIKFLFLTYIGNFPSHNFFFHLWLLLWNLGFINLVIYNHTIS